MQVCYYCKLRTLSTCATGSIAPASAILLAHSKISSRNTLVDLKLARQTRLLTPNQHRAMHVYVYDKQLCIYIIYIYRYTHTHTHTHTHITTSTAIQINLLYYIIYICILLSRVDDKKTRRCFDKNKSKSCLPFPGRLARCVQEHAALLCASEPPPRSPGRTPTSAYVRVRPHMSAYVRVRPSLRRVLQAEYLHIYLLY
jgi:hypothetical protein